MTSLTHVKRLVATDWLEDAALWKYYIGIISFNLRGQIDVGMSGRARAPDRHDNGARAEARKPRSPHPAPKPPICVGFRRNKSMIDTVTSYL